LDRGRRDRSHAGYVGRASSHTRSRRQVEEPGPARPVNIPLVLVRCRRDDRGRLEGGVSLKQNEFSFGRDNVK
jgi:hypothetical protein